MRLYKKIIHDGGWASKIHNQCAKIYKYTYAGADACEKSQSVCA